MSPRGDRRRLAGWAMAVAALGTTVSAFALIGPFAVFYLAVVFTIVVFGTLVVIVARQACSRRSLDGTL